MPDPAAARALLREAGYDGRPIVIPHAANVPLFSALAPVTEQALTAIGIA